MAPITTLPATAHQITVGWVPNNHGYPYKAQCACGWSSAGYVATHAAEGMGNWHLETEAGR